MSLNETFAFSAITFAFCVPICILGTYLATSMLNKVMPNKNALLKNIDDASERIYVGDKSPYFALPVKSVSSQTNQDTSLYFDANDDKIYCKLTGANAFEVYVTRDNNETNRIHNKATNATNATNALVTIVSAPSKGHSR